jgi:hypothetical protein
MFARSPAGRSRSAIVVVVAAVTMIATLAGFGAQLPDPAAPPVAAAASPAVGAAQAAVPCSPFPDVNSTNQHCRNIEWLMGVGITKPADGLYHSDGSVTRGSMAAFLFRLVRPGRAQPTCTSRPFPDVPITSTFCGYISWARNNGIAYGYSNGNYGPENPVTRGAMAAYLFRIANPGQGASACTTKPFRDVPVTDTFCGVITWMVDNHITYGVGDGTNYGTTSPVTRGAMASFLRRIAERSGAPSDGFVLSVDGRRAVVVTLTSIRPVPRIAGAAAAQHRYLKASVTIRGYAGLAEVPGHRYLIDRSHWTVTARGTTYRAITSGPMAGTLDATKLGPGDKVTGTVTFDAPAHGTLTLQPSGFDPIRWTF